MFGVLRDAILYFREIIFCYLNHIYWPMYFSHETSQTFFFQNLRDNVTVLMHLNLIVIKDDL